MKSLKKRFLDNACPALHRREKDMIIEIDLKNRKENFMKT
jgi:hypothetical protein